MQPLTTKGNSPPNLHNEALAARTLLSALSSEQDTFAEEDAELAVASETNLVEAIEAALLANAQDAAHIQTLKSIILTMEGRMERKAARIERRKGAVLAAMEIVGLPKLELATATVSVGKGRRKVIITDAELIPAEFMREKVTRSPDKDAIAEALLGKTQVPGAELSNTMPTLTVRHK
jgi:hypothetical protein